MAGVPTDYHRASVAEKLRMQRSGVRPPALTCPFCQTRTPEGGLLEHIDSRCTGARPVHDLSRWVGWAEAVELGATEPTLHRWVKSGLVRARGQRGDRRYLLPDLQLAIALQRPHPRLRSRLSRVKVAGAKLGKKFGGG